MPYASFSVSVLLHQQLLKKSLLGAKKHANHPHRHPATYRNILAFRGRLCCGWEIIPGHSKRLMHWELDPGQQCYSMVRPISESPDERLSEPYDVSLRKDEHCSGGIAVLSCWVVSPSCTCNLEMTPCLHRGYPRAKQGAVSYDFDFHPLKL